MEVLYVRYRILISDDEVDIVEMLTGFFRSKGYEVFSAYNGVETLKLAELQPDIILLDINMPKLDGMEVCKKIRDYVSCPILFLTARIEENDKVQGFSVGGDDYIVKPFSLVELEARVQAHLRREERHQTNTKVKFSGELLIDYSERTVYIQNQPIGLVKKEFDIVELLSQNAGQVFDKERIYERVWGYDSEGDSSVVAEHIRRIRTKIAAYATSKVNITYTSNNDGFYLSVSDNGCGFSKNILSKATNPYFTEEENHSEHFGLGLYICKILCEHHGGYLKIENCSIGAKVTAFFKSLD